MKFKRILLKLSGESLAGSKGTGIDFDRVLDVCREIKEVAELGIEVAIVVGGGNFWRGRSNQQMDRCTSDYIGMLGTFGRIDGHTQLGVFEAAHLVVDEVGVDVGEFRQSLGNGKEHQVVDGDLFQTETFGIFHSLAHFENGGGIEGAVQSELCHIGQRSVHVFGDDLADTGDGGRPHLHLLDQQIFAAPRSYRCFRLSYSQQHPRS